MVQSESKFNLSSNRSEN